MKTRIRTVDCCTYHTPLSHTRVMKLDPWEWIPVWELSMDAGDKASTWVIARSITTVEVVVR